MSCPYTNVPFFRWYATKKPPTKSHRFHVLPPLKNHPSKAIGFMYSPLWKPPIKSPSVLCTPPFEKTTHQNPFGFVYSPLWKITHHNPSVLCTPPFEKSPIQKPSVLCTPPFEKSPITNHRFCVLPPLKNHPLKPKELSCLRSFTSEEEWIGHNGDVFEAHAHEIGGGGAGERLGRLGFRRVEGLWTLEKHLKAQKNLMSIGPIRRKEGKKRKQTWCTFFWH